MNKNFGILLREFKTIAKKRWIKGVSNGHGNIGLTFENELGKKVDTNYSPDYNDIELKCTTRFSRFPVTLFSLAFDGPTDTEIIRLNETYGSYDSDFSNKKTLIRKIRVGELSLLKNNYYLSLILENDKLFLCVYDINQNLIEKEAFVYLNSIKQHLLTKLNNLAIIKASKIKNSNLEYFRYYEISFYTLKSYDTFINLLKEGIIEISLISRISKSGETAGKYHNKNLVFQIKKDFIDFLFDKIYYFNHDNINSYKNELQIL